jgi:hypothetical protein
MSSLAAERVGSQEPRLRFAPPAVSSLADDACFLAGAYGLVPDPWQRTVLEDWLGLRADGKWAASRAGLAVPRQNGKNAVLEVRELFGMVDLGERFLHTAHEVKTARKAFLRLLEFFDNRLRYPELADLVREIRRTNGQEAILLHNGGGVEFVARTRGSGRGFTVDVLVLDEAQELDDEAYAALLPTVSSAPMGNPQQILTGTPPKFAEVFARMRSSVLEGSSRRSAWDEWSCEPDADLDDPEEWGRANPSLGARPNAIGIETIADERSAMDDESFARERLGVWVAGAAGSSVIPSDSWSLAADATSIAEERLTLAVDVSPGRDMAAVGLAGLRDDGLWHVELDEHRQGVEWVPAWLEQRAERNRLHAVVLDEKSGLAEKRNGRWFVAGTDVAVTLASAEGRDMAIACAKFFDATMGQKMRHTDQPQLNVALSVARKRAVGDGWAWNRKSASSDITPLVACTLALWGAQSSTVNPPKRRSGSGKVVVLA